MGPPLEPVAGDTADGNKEDVSRDDAIVAVRREKEDQEQEQEQPACIL